MRSLLLPCFIACLGACSPERPDTLDSAQREAIADTIRSIVERTDRAYETGNVAEHTAAYADSGVVLAAGGGVIADGDTIRDYLNHVADTTGAIYRITLERGPMHVEVLGVDAAVMTGTYVATMTNKATGDETRDTYARTTVFSRRAGRWVVVHEHESWMESGAADASAPVAGDSGSTHAH